MLTAQQAAAMRIGSYAVPTEAPDGKVAEIADRIPANPRWAVRGTKTA